MLESKPAAEARWLGTWRRAIAFTVANRAIDPHGALGSHIHQHTFSPTGLLTMGNCFGKPSDKNFSGEGRAVGSTAAAPAQKKATANKASAPTAGRTLGSSSQAPSGSSPRDAAAKAAEVRTYQYTTELSQDKTRNKAPKQMVATAWM